jgi:hypothetical protein
MRPAHRKAAVRRSTSGTRGYICAEEEGERWKHIAEPWVASVAFRFQTGDAREPVRSNFSWKAVSGFI